MTETAEAAFQQQPYTQTDKKLSPTTSPLWHYIRENCQKCPFTTNTLDKCDSEQQLKCILARISLDLHTLTRINIIRATAEPQ